MPASGAQNEGAQAGENRQKQHVTASQIRLLYENAITGIVVTVVASPILAYFQSTFIRHWIIASWLAYILLVSGARFSIWRRFRRKSPGDKQVAGWGDAFVAGAGLAGLGWGAAGFLLYPESEHTNQVFLVFVIGGMMLGGASLLAARKEAFLSFLLPTGILPAIRLLAEGDNEHVLMGLLAILFTAATVTTTWRFHRTIESSLYLQFANKDLLQDLKIANAWAESLNQQLELRVQQRTAELQRSTERLRAEIKQRQHMEDELLRVRNLESLGVLAGGIAHDFNNFLTIVQGNIELAKIQLNPDSPVHEVLEDSSNACQRAAFLSSQLLTFAKGGAPIRRVVSIAKLVMDSVHLARAGAPVIIEADIAEDLWPAEVDSGQIGQVLHNILLNAKQAMPQGGTVEVRAENVIPVDDAEPGTPAQIRISIRDYGPGIPADVLPRIFDPYFTTKRSGSGLGLATSHAIISKHGGHIFVESKGEGTEFILILPASREAPVREKPVAAEPLRSGTGRLLVMDDEELLRTLLERSLSTLGYEVESASDGGEAIALYQAAQAAGRIFDAVLLDVTVTGGMGGIEAARQLKELDPSVKLIVSSGYSDAAVMSRFREYGFEEVIPKPWHPAQVSEVFRRVLASRDKRKAADSF